LKARDSATLQKHICSDEKTISRKYYCPSVRVTALNKTLSGYSAWQWRVQAKTKQMQKATFHRDSVQLLLATMPLRPVWVAVTRTGQKSKLQ
jgi:hypothetical protein